MDYANNLGTQSNPWSDMRLNIERNYKDLGSYDYNIVRTKRNYTRRDFKYDNAVENIVNVPKYRNKTSLEYSPSSKEDFTVTRYSQSSSYRPSTSKYTYEGFSPSSFRDSSSKYLYDSKYKAAYNPTSTFGIERSSNYIQGNTNRLINRTSALEVTSTFSPQSNSRRKLDLGGIVGKWTNTRGSDVMPGKMSYISNKEFTDFSPSNREFAEISRQITYKGGLSPASPSYYDHSRSYQNVLYDNDRSYQPAARDFDYDVKQVVSTPLSQYNQRPEVGATNYTREYTESYSRDLVTKNKSYRQSVGVRPGTALDRLTTYTRQSNYEKSPVAGTKSFYSTLKNYGRYSQGGGRSTAIGGTRKYRSIQDNEFIGTMVNKFTKSSARY